MSAFAIVADTRNYAQGSSADMAIKTFSLGPRVGAVAAGSALSCSTAAELTRTFTSVPPSEPSAAPWSFYDTARLYAFFLEQAEARNPWSPGCEVALAGFWKNSTPALAKVTTRRAQDTVLLFYGHEGPGALVAFVGQRDGKQQIASALEASFQGESTEWFERAVGTLWYLARHEGEPTIGGAPSVGMSLGANVFWPFVAIDDRYYLRGFDFTDMGPPTPEEPVLRIDYEESWHSEVDQLRHQPELRVDAGFRGLAAHLRACAVPSNLFKPMHDPEVFREPATRQGLPHFVIVIRPGELDTVG